MTTVTDQPDGVGGVFVPARLLCAGCKRVRPREEFLQREWAPGTKGRHCSGCRKKSTPHAQARRRAAALDRVALDMRTARPPAPGWGTRAACGRSDTGVDADDFTGAGTPAARALCACCPVARSCLEEALAKSADPDRQHGYVGRRTAQQRTDILLARAALSDLHAGS